MRLTLKTTVVFTPLHSRSSVDAADEPLNTCGVGSRGLTIFRSWSPNVDPLITLYSQCTKLCFMLYWVQTSCCILLMDEKMTWAQKWTLTSSLSSSGCVVLTTVVGSNRRSCCCCCLKGQSRSKGEGNSKVNYYRPTPSCCRSMCVAWRHQYLIVFVIS